MLIERCKMLGSRMSTQRLCVKEPPAHPKTTKAARLQSGG